MFQQLDINRPIIVRYFSRNRPISRSTGIPKILREMAANGSPAPEFDSDDDRTYYLVRLPVHPRAKTADQAQSPTQSPTQSENPVIRLLAVLRDGDLSPKDLRLRLGLSHRPTFRENYLNPAMEDTLIEPTIPDKPTSRLQKYRLTEKGRKLLENS